MSILQNKIDFTVLVKVINANPNGDPLNGNRPRTTYSGQGEISDVCIKRKIRNRLQDMGENIFVQSAERSDDGYTSLSERASQNITNYQSDDDYAEQACKKWIDVRTFGQVFAFKAKDKKEGVSVGVRGPVSIHQALSCSPVDINSIEFGLYRIKGSVNVQLAEKTGFSEEDAGKLKETLCTLFVNDASAARPDGSMEVVSVYWWKHNNKIGQYSAAKVHDSLKISLKEGVVIPSSVEDYEIRLEELPALEAEVISGM